MRPASPYRVPGERAAVVEAATLPAVAPVAPPEADDSDADLAALACENDAFVEPAPQIPTGRIIFLTAVAIVMVLTFLAVCQR